MKKPSLKKRHFSLIELLVVIGIIGILSAIILPALSGARNSANKTHIKAQLQNIQLACNNYFSDYGHLPNDSNSGTDSSDINLTAVIDALNGTTNVRGKSYYSGDSKTFDNGNIFLKFDYDYNNELTNVSADNDTVNGKIAVFTTYENEEIKSWVK